MFISKRELVEMRYLNNGGSVICALLLRRMIRKGLITCRFVWSNRPDNNYHCELTDKGRECLCL